MATKTNSYKDRGSTCVSALKNLYVAMGGELTDTYSDIASGAAVSTLTIIPDCVNVVAKQAAKNQPSGKLSITSTAEVACSAYATAQVSDANLTAENIKKDVSVLGITGSYEGGGSSDFSTAEVTLTSNTYEHSIPITVVYVIEEEDATIFAMSGIDLLGDADVLTVPLYKGSCFLSINPNTTGWSFSATGNIEYLLEQGFIITGDGAISATYTG